MAFQKIKFQDFAPSVKELINSKVEAEEVYKKEEIDQKLSNVGTKIGIYKRSIKIEVIEDGIFEYDLSSHNLPSLNVVTILSVNTNLIDDYELKDNTLTLKTDDAPLSGDVICLVVIYLE